MCETLLSDCSCASMEYLLAERVAQVKRDCMQKKVLEFLGFTLIELLIAMAIMGILASVSYPYYNDSVKKSRRVDAINTLIQLQIEQEKFRSRSMGYATQLSDLPVRVEKKIFLSHEGYYEITLLSASSTSFEIIAKPVADGPQKEDECSVFKVSVNGPELKNEEARRCWNL